MGKRKRNEMKFYFDDDDDKFCSPNLYRFDKTHRWTFVSDKIWLPCSFIPKITFKQHNKNCGLGDRSIIKIVAVRWPWQGFEPKKRRSFDYGIWMKLSTKWPIYVICKLILISIKMMWVKKGFQRFRFKRYIYQDATFWKDEEERINQVCEKTKLEGRSFR